VTLTVLTWLWSQPGGRTEYRAEHVNIWAAMVRRHLAMPHRIACVTDMPQGIDPRIEIIAPPGEFEDVRIPTWGPERPQCLRRLAMFRRDAADIFGERFVCMDLDCIIGEALDPLFEGDVDFRICKGTRRDRPYNGSMMMLRAGARPKVYENFTATGARVAGQHFVGSDQAWISHILGPNEATWSLEDGVIWHVGWRCHSPRLMFFPGFTKPADFVVLGKDEWMNEHYRGDAEGRCMVLGYEDGLWRDVEAALEAGPIAAVIASPEAAEHWPGPVLAVAETNAAAARIARMHGFTDIAWCGVKERAAA
jgi:hypothetical protein